MLKVDLPVSLNTSFRVSPFSRLTPLKEASCAVVLICASTLLYCATRLARVDCELGSAIGALPPDAAAKKAWPDAAAEPVSAPMVEDAASFDVMMLMCPVVSTLACRLFAASALLSAFRFET